MNYYTIPIVIIAYLLGSFPTAYYAGMWLKGIDLRTVGSGNLGFTNAQRELGLWVSIPILVIDIVKGLLAVLLPMWLMPENNWLPIACGLVAILGHNWTVFLGFRGGGKGVATSAGVFMGLALVPFLNALLIFIIILATFRIMSLASISGAVVLAVSSGVFIMLGHESAPSVEVFIFSVTVALLIIGKHRGNIKRLMQGQEPKMGKPKRGEAEQ